MVARATVVVHLDGMAGYRWSEPVVQESKVLALVASAQSANGGVDATLRALIPGTTQLTASEDPTCLPSCGRPSRLWSVTIVVKFQPVPA